MIKVNVVSPKVKEPSFTCQYCGSQYIEEHYEEYMTMYYTSWAPCYCEDKDIEVAIERDYHIDTTYIVTCVWDNEWVLRDESGSEEIESDEIDSEEVEDSCEVHCQECAEEAKWGGYEIEEVESEKEYGESTFLCDGCGREVD